MRRAVGLRGALRVAAAPRPPDRVDREARGEAEVADREVAHELERRAPELLEQEVTDDDARAPEERERLGALPPRPSCDMRRAIAHLSIAGSWFIYSYRRTS